MIYYSEFLRLKCHWNMDHLLLIQWIQTVPEAVFYDTLKTFVKYIKINKVDNCCSTLKTKIKFQKVKK